MSDVVTFGEAMIRLSPPGFQRLEQTTSLDLHIGGSELNVAAGLARLGVKSTWVSRVPHNALGRLIENRVRQTGVDTSHLICADEGRLGLYFVEFGAAPRPSSVLYDRTHSAFCMIRPDQIDWPSVFAGAKWFHVSGITPALSDSAATVTRQAMQAARAAGLTVSYDLNYRSKLWPLEKARAVQEPLMEFVDMLITAEGDAARMFDVHTKSQAQEHEFAALNAESYKEVAQRLQQRFGFSAVALTLRENPLVWRNTFTAIAYADGRCYEDVTYDVEIVDRIGTGDAFCAGFIYGCLVKQSYEAAVRYGNAFAALKHSHPGDFNWATLEEVESLLRGAALRIAR
ncbi:MAG: PfkB family carbohydrate kinase [Candidatus Binatia bacterium]